MKLYHHETHQKHIRKSSILKLQMDENTLLGGQKKCVAFLESSIKDITDGSSNLDESSQRILLNETEKVFTPEDNEILLKTPSKDEVYKMLSESNVHAAPGSDGLTSLVYKEHFDI